MLIRNGQAVLAQFFSPVSILVSFIRSRYPRSWQVSGGGIKLGLTMPPMYRLQIYLASFRLVLLPF